MLHELLFLVCLIYTSAYVLQPYGPMMCEEFKGRFGNCACDITLCQSIKAGIRGDVDCLAGVSLKTRTKGMRILPRGNLPRQLLDATDLPPETFRKVIEESCEVQRQGKRLQLVSAKCAASLITNNNSAVTLQLSNGFSRIVSMRFVFETCQLFSVLNYGNSSKEIRLSLLTNNRKKLKKLKLHDKGQARHPVQFSFLVQHSQKMTIVHVNSEPVITLLIPSLPTSSADTLNHLKSDDTGIVIHFGGKDMIEVFDVMTTPPNVLEQMKQFSTVFANTVL